MFRPQRPSAHGAAVILAKTTCSGFLKGVWRRGYPVMRWCRLAGANIARIPLTPLPPQLQRMSFTYRQLFSRYRQYTIGYWHDTVVCLSVCPSIRLGHCTLWRSGSLWGVESCTVVFLGRHFLFTSSDIFAVGCIVQPQHKTKPNRRNFSLRRK